MLCNPFISEFLVSELQAAYMIMYKENHPEDIEVCSESGKDRREEIQDEAEIVGQIESFVEQDERLDEETDKTKRELSLLLEALHMDASSNLIDVQDQVGETVHSRLCERFRPRF